MGGEGEEGEMRSHNYYSCLIWMKKQGLPVRGGIGDGGGGRAAQLCEEARVSSYLGVFFHLLPLFVGFSGVLVLVLSLVFSYLSDLRLAVRVLYILGVLFNFFMGLSHSFLFLYVWAFFSSVLLFSLPGYIYAFIGNLLGMVVWLQWEWYCGPLMTLLLNN